MLWAKRSGEQSLAYVEPGEVVLAHHIATSWLTVAIAPIIEIDDRARSTDDSPTKRASRPNLWNGTTILGGANQGGGAPCCLSPSENRGDRVVQQSKPLERREVLTTFHAANLAQLQADLTAVSGSSGPNTIIMASGNFQVTSPLQVQNSGNLLIEGTTTKGIGTELLGNDSGRILNIDGGSVTIFNMTVAGGGNVAQGGGILAQNTNLTIKNSAVVNNKASQTGAGIAFQGGTLLVTNSWIGNNGVYGSDNTFGGGIAASNARVTVDQTLVFNNSAVSNNLNAQPKPISASGGAIYTQNGTLTITGGVFANNFASAITAGSSAVASGGAVATSNTTASLSKARVQNNELDASAHQVNTTQGIAFSTAGGSLTITSSVFAGRVIPVRSLFSHPGATVTLKHSNINGKQLNGTYILGSKGFTPEN